MQLDKHDKSKIKCSLSVCMYVYVFCCSLSSDFPFECVTPLLIPLQLCTKFEFECESLRTALPCHKEQTNPCFLTKYSHILGTQSSSSSSPQPRKSNQAEGEYCLSEEAYSNLGYINLCKRKRHCTHYQMSDIDC